MFGNRLEFGPERERRVARFSIFLPRPPTMDSPTVKTILRELKELPATDWAALIFTFVIIGFVAWTSTQFDRRTVIEPKAERVLVVGASSGIGKAIALQYASRGAMVAVMGRRKPELQSVRDDCQSAGSAQATAIVADFSDVDAMIKARNAVERGENGSICAPTNTHFPPIDFGGLDTLIVAAGVSALQPLITGVARTARDDDGNFTTATTKANVQRAKEVASAAISGNYLGPLVSAVTFVSSRKASLPRLFAHSVDSRYLCLK